MRRFVLAALLTTLGTAYSLMAAQSDRSSIKKTVEIQATAKVGVPAELATVKIGYANQAVSKDTAYAENTRMSQKIVRALLDEHVPSAAIETESVALEREEERGESIPAKVLKFSALQEWRVHVAAADAQKVVDIAVGAGATNVGGVDWEVKDPQALEAQAYAAAIDRAKKIAEQTASHSGIKLGEIVSVVNFVNRFGFGGGGGLNTEAATLVSSRSVTTVPLTLYPPKIERQASVTVTYAIAP
jgi:uncharacterized protein YggE